MGKILIRKGNWQLAAGCWQLAAGNWQLADSRWEEVASFRTRLRIKVNWLQPFKLAAPDTSGLIASRES